MSGRIRTKAAFIFLVACFCVAAAVPLQAQFGTGRDVLGPARVLQGEQDRQPSRNPMADRRVQAQDDIQGSARQLGETLVAVLQKVNRGERLTPEEIQESKAAHEAARKYATRFDNGLQCEVLMLQAWTDYFQQDFEKAFFAARQAYRTDRTNHDANATQAVMSIIMDRAPERLEARVERTVPGRGGADPYAARQNERSTQIGVRPSTGNILQMEVDAVDLESIGKPIAPMRLNCLSGTTLDYDPARSTLCILFWQTGGGPMQQMQPGEPNMPGQPMRAPLSRSTPPNVYDSRMQPRGDAYYDSGRRDPSYDSYRPAAVHDAYGHMAMHGAAPGDELGRAAAAYSRLFGQYITNPQVTFLGVNTDPLTAAPAAVQKVLENPWPWAHVMAALPLCGAGQFSEIKPPRPTMAIVNGGKIRYAGPAEGFMAPLVLAHVAGEPVPLSAIAAAASSVAAGGGLPGPLANLIGRAGVTPPSVGAERPAQPQRPALPQPARGGEEEEELTVENLQAERKLAAASDLFIPAGRQSFLTSKRGVDMCREIIRDYPNTKYAQEARRLLRKVPEHERRRYNVTDEEMGL